MQTPTQSNGVAGRAHAGANIIVLIARAGASPLEAISRRGFGPKYFGLPTLASFFVLLLWPALCGAGEQSPLIQLFLAVYVIALLVARTESLRAAKNGEMRHTRYNGFPRLARLFPRWPESKLKGLEIIVWFVLGGLTLHVDRALGSFLIFGAASLGLLACTFETIERAKVEQLNDSLIEQQSIAERFREMQRDRR